MSRDPQPCPICDRTMDRATHRDLAIDRCEEHGLWFWTPEWQRLQTRLRNARPRAQDAASVDSASAPAAPDDDAALRPRLPTSCPACRTTMRVRESTDVWRATPTVRLDVCDAHGVWLPRGALELLIERACQDARRQRRIRRLKDRIRVERHEQANTIEQGVLGALFSLSD